MLLNKKIFVYFMYYMQFWSTKLVPHLYELSTLPRVDSTQFTYPKLPCIISILILLLSCAEVQM